MKWSHFLHQAPEIETSDSLARVKILHDGNDSFAHSRNEHFDEGNGIMTVTKTSVLLGRLGIPQSILKKTKDDRSL